MTTNKKQKIGHKEKEEKKSFIRDRIESLNNDDDDNQEIFVCLTRTTNLRR